MKETKANDIEKLSRLVNGIQFAMMTTVSKEDQRLHSRPMTLQKTEFDGDFWFFVGKTSPIAADIAQNAEVNLAFANPKDNSYVSVSGEAEVVADKNKAQELWNPALKAWFPKGLEDPDLALIRVSVESADYWDAADSKVVQLYGFAKAILTGQRPGAEIGEHRHVSVNPANAS